ncbi:MAG: methyltransferase domain-containing protein [Clostridia bacterium]|nr:methyltransferase domain-containing protein [Clostridia bacterium]
MVDLLVLQKQFICAHLHAGEVAIDFTMGNGYDTLFLSQTVGENGRVYAFDIQPEALVSTEKRLKEANAPENYTLICASHHLLKEYVGEPFKAGMFNLGWLPGNGNHEVTTQWVTTKKAIEAALSQLLPDGILLVAVYPGHEEGTHEGEALGAWLSTFDRKKICCSRFQIINSPTSPYFYVIEKK